MLAPEEPCQGAQGQLSRYTGTRYSKSAHAPFFTSLPLGPGCSAIPLCDIPFTRRLSLTCNLGRWNGKQIWYFPGSEPASINVKGEVHAGIGPRSEEERSLLGQLCWCLIYILYSKKISPFPGTVFSFSRGFNASSFGCQPDLSNPPSNWLQLRSRKSFLLIWLLSDGSKSGLKFQSRSICLYAHQIM